MRKHWRAGAANERPASMFEMCVFLGVFEGRGGGDRGELQCKSEHPQSKSLVVGSCCRASPELFRGRPRCLRAVTEWRASLLSCAACRQ